MDIYEALKTDHRKVADLLSRLVAVSEKEEGSRLIAQIRDELVPHSRAEEAVFYNSIRAINTAQDLVWHGYEEHMEAETLLRTLQGLDAVNVEWKKVAQKLKSAIEHHVNEEENKIMPVAQQLFTSEEAEAMAQAFEEMKPEVREGGIVQSTLDLVANMLPTRLGAPLRSFMLHENPGGARQ
jgi:hemerythrin superfamily protein